MDQAERMMALFAGARTVHGKHGVNAEKQGVKVHIKPTARTWRKPVNSVLWQKHLDNVQALGIVPLDEESTCIFGTIDVDKYDISLLEFQTRIDKAKLPCVVTRSKSGGAHVHLFLKSRVPASAIRAKLLAIAELMGWGGCEIFPKHDILDLEKINSRGNWINMPYLGGDTTDRYCVKRTGIPMSLLEFLDWAESRRVELSDVIVPSAKPKATATPIKLNGSGFNGPVCVQYFQENGVPEGGRNTAMCTTAVMLYRMQPDRWKEALSEWNELYCHPPLPQEEVNGIVINFEKSGFGYLCKQPPCSTYCDVAVCKTREFGVGDSSAYPVVSGLSKMLCDPPLWFVTLSNGTRLQLATEQLHNYRAFQLVALNHSLVFLSLKQDTWLEMVKKAMETCTTVEAPPEAGLYGQFMELLEEFCMQRGRGDKPDDVLLGNAWHDQEAKQYVFRFTSFTKFLKKHDFKSWNRNKVSATLRDIGGPETHTRLIVKNQRPNVYRIPATFEAAAILDTIDDIKEKPI